LLSSLMKLNWFSLSFLIFDVFSYMWFSRYIRLIFHQPSQSTASYGLR